MGVIVDRITRMAASAICLNMASPLAAPVAGAVIRTHFGQKAFQSGLAIAPAALNLEI
jgi:hypothetical protein